MVQSFLSSFHLVCLSVKLLAKKSWQSLIFWASFWPRKCYLCCRWSKTIPPGFCSKTREHSYKHCVSEQVPYVLKTYPPKEDLAIQIGFIYSDIHLAVSSFCLSHFSSFLPLLHPTLPPTFPVKILPFSIYLNQIIALLGVPMVSLLQTNQRQIFILLEPIFIVLIHTWRLKAFFVKGNLIYFWYS